jgi:hypothetical protein
MKLEIIETPNYILAVSDERVSLVCPNYYWDYKDKDFYKFSEDMIDDMKKEDRPIIAYLPKGDAPELDLPLLPEMEVGDDVEKLAKEANLKREFPSRGYGEDEFVEGYKAATKVYSEEDLRIAFRAGQKYGEDNACNAKIDLNYNEDAYINSLNKSKTPKWFVTETTGGGEYLAGEIGGNEIWAEYPIELKTTTTNGKTYLVGKYINE